MGNCLGLKKKKTIKKEPSTRINIHSVKSDLNRLGSGTSSNPLSTPVNSPTQEVLSPGAIELPFLEPSAFQPIRRVGRQLSLPQPWHPTRLPVDPTRGSLSRKPRVCE